MVGGGPQVLEQQQQSLPQPLSAANEEAVKRNTDCVYFLASPLTCKKGSECEYRHSEYARVNPRDCWFWLNGNCLNPKCSFRHPPLDGLVGTPHSTNSSSQIPSQTSAIPSAPVNSSKQGVPCIFFQKGLCLKGDRCAFLHGPSPVPMNKVPQTTANAQTGKPPSVKKVSGGTLRSGQEQKIPRADCSKSIDGAPLKLATKDETVPSNVGDVNEKSGPPAEVADDGSRYKATNSLPVLNESSLSRASRLQPSHVIDDYGLQNGKDADEFLRETSPGFDVLVDDELRGSGYYESEEQYGRTRGHEGTNMISMNDYEIGHSSDYKMISDVDHDVYNNVIDYDYDSRQGQYGWDRHRSSSEKFSMGSAQMDKRLFPKSNSPEHIQTMDLRHRLNKQRRGNGLRSVINNEHTAGHPEERNYHAPRRDSHLSQENSTSNRLRGRIKLPRIPSPVRNSNLQPERDLNRGRPWGRLLPGRSQSLSHEGSNRDEMKGRLEEDYNNEGRNFNGLSSRRDRMDGTSDFAAPKSLAALKDKHVGTKEQQTLGKRKGSDNEQSGGELSFEGPKSLGEILKKKRQVKSDVDPLVNNDERERCVGSIERSTTPLLKQSGLSSTAKQESNSLEGTKSSPAEAFGLEENIDVSHHLSSQLMHSTDGHEIEAYDETLEEDHEYEGDDQRDCEYKYEQVDYGEYNYEEGENINPEEEYMDDEDGDDFAKKIGVMS
ncbi:zinc finger CCCH domain-containing protein 17-like [Cucurbita pepo subsp. pepo]|uniref:zinc finger CCCH domain-containing protein 17-like n=1 Tax=Cucurbita pepo subsp. pepo TaxID=3664 RepID=UPI000C9D9B2C|nr:zinc finger CCCH domain-containing protein 17-like [Cucurbita pepo subsp. pepo]XP_023539870.1 zinc finger CCCH domain-containing protein 17-like [Cucurbita pepo subsp. pepo]